MPGELHQFLSRDHERLDALLARAVRGDGSVDSVPYEEFRGGLLRHISIEERVLFRVLRAERGATALEQQLHRDHAALAALLVPPPTADGIARIRAILEAHNPLEEQPNGLYEILETLSGSELAALMQQVHAIPAVPLAPHADTPVVRKSIEQLVREAEEGRKA